MTITINGQTFELNAEQESKLKVALGLQGKQLSEIAVGEIANIAGIDWIVLEQNGDSVLCLAKDFVYENTKFDNNTNNYANSSIRQTLNGEFLDKITKEIGADAILATEIDLTSDDGLDDYGKVTAKVGLLGRCRRTSWKRHGRRGESRQTPLSSAFAHDWKPARDTKPFSAPHNRF